MRKNKIRLTKKGAASIYVVAIITLILGIIVVSFARIVISENIKTANDDLAQSAYDSAMAGVEDAKIGIINCMRDGKSLDQCGLTPKTIAERANECNYFAKDGKGRGTALHYINRKDDGTGVLVQTDKEKGNETAQAYTCVTLDDITEDYRSTLEPGKNVQMVPIKTEGASGISKIKISWYSNRDKQREIEDCKKNNGSCAFPVATSAPMPPVLSASLIRGGSGFNFDNVISDDDNRTFGTAILYPSKNSGTNTLNSGDLDNIADAAVKNTPFEIKCSKEAEFACSVTLKTGNLTGNMNFLVLSLPYHNTTSDFMVELYNDESKPVDFRGAQVKVDSTGRANDLYRRVDARVSLADIYFPYPEYALESDGGGGKDGDILKNFYVTKNCWKADDGKVETCANAGAL